MPQILVIDDDEQMNALLCEMLVAAGYDVLSATGGAQAERLLAAHEIKVVVTDILMPEMDGMEVILKLRFQPSPPAVVAVSGGGKYHNAAQCLQWANDLGIKHTFAKPIERSKFLKRIKKLME